MKGGTEHGLVNAHSGQKLDEFGSRTDLSQLTIKKRRTKRALASGDLVVSRMPIEVSAAERARWLAELADALEQAERLVWSLGELPRSDPEMIELYGSLDAA